MKKWLLICGIWLFVISDLVFANGFECNSDYFSGVYLGVGTGVSNTKSNISNIVEDIIENNIVDNSPFEIDFLNEINSDKAGNTQGIFHIFTGFGKVLNEYFYLGGELFIKYAPTANDISVKRFHGRNENEIKTNDSLTEINLKNIYLVTNKIMFYGLIGLDNRFFKYRVKHKIVPFGVVLFDPSFFLQYDYGFKKNKLALTPGIGIEAMVYKNISLRLQYSYSTYEKIKHHNDYSTNYVLEDVEYDYNSHAEDTIDLSKGVFTIDLSFRLDK